MFKYAFILFLLATFSGCATHAVVPELEGRPRVPVNKIISTKPALQSFLKESTPCYENLYKA